MFSALGYELRYAVRTLRRTPSLTLASMLTLALGIGATSTIFSVVYGVLLRPLPYRDPGALVQLAAVQAGSGRRMNFSLPEFQDWERDTRTLAGVALFSVDELSMTSRENSTTVKGAYVSPRFFDVLGTRPLLGRWPFSEDEPLTTAIVSERLWRGAFGARPDILGAGVTLNGRPYTVIGVAPAGLQFPTPEVDVWTPLEYAATFAPPRWKMRGFRAFSMIGRTVPGVSIRQANDDAVRIAQALERTYPRFSGGLSASVTPLAQGITGSVRPALLLLFAVVGVVLLIACANLANLSLVRSAARTRETAIRVAVGATRWHIVRQFAVESAVIAAAGAALGLLLAVWGVRALTTVRPEWLPRVAEIRLDAPVLAFTFVTTVIATLLFGTVPGILASRHQTGLLREANSAPRIRRLHAALIVAEIALSTALVIAGTLVTRSFIALTHADTGVHRTDLLTMKLNLGSTAFVRPENQTAFLTRALANLRSIPGVQLVATISSLPPSTSQMHTTVSVQNERTGTPDEVAVEVVAVSPDVFTTLGVPLIAGRTFDDGDTASARPVIVIGATAARRLFPDVDPVGHPLAFGSTPGSDPLVVGVVGDVKYSGLDTASGGAIYMPYPQRVLGSTYLVVRTNGDPASLADVIRRSILQIEPTIGISMARPFDVVLADAVAQPRFRTWLLLLLAGLALALAIVGLYGVVSYTVGQRTAEIGVRIALGASSSRVLAMVLHQGLTLAVAGITLGIVGAAALRRTLSVFLYGVGPTDVASFAIAGASVLVVSAIAVLGPARRATAVDPLIALHAE